MEYPKNLESLNPDRKSLTVETLKTFEGFENISFEEAENIVYSIQTLCRIVYEYMVEQNNAENNNPKNIAA